MSAIICKNLSYTYPDGTQVLRNINFQIEAQEKVALIGANGSGKSTLQFHLNGLIAQQSGEIWIGSQPVLPQSLKAIRTQVGFVFQNPDDQLFLTTVWDDIAFGPKNLGLKDPVLSQRVEQALLTVQLEPSVYGPRHPDRLSGGEKKRVAIAGVLAMEPAILVLDEPSAQLDPAARRRLIHLLHSLPLTQLIATHDLDLVLELCDRTLVLSEGHLVYDGPTYPLMLDPAFLQAHRLESPLSFQRAYCHLSDRPDSP